MNHWKFKIGPFNLGLNSSVASVFRHIGSLYSKYSVIADEDVFVDFHVGVHEMAGYRKFYKPQASFFFDGYQPFAPLPLSQAVGLFEWGVNWVIANNSHQYIIFHAAILEKNGLCLLMPGSPGSGKSTLCAALMYKGWRLFSDEMALLSLNDGLMYPVPRPIGLKNQSIRIISNFAPEAILGEIIPDTTKGNIAYLRALASAVEQQDIPAVPAILLFPHYQSMIDPQLHNMSKGRAFMALAQNAFNFNILGSEGFNAMAGLIHKVKCYDFSYPDLDSALDGINSLL